MLYVLLRSEGDAVINPKTGLPIENKVEGLPVQDDIVPHGGVVLTEIMRSANYYMENVGTQKEKVMVRRERKVLRTEPGDDGKSTNYFCEPTRADAQYLVTQRFGWQLAMFADESQIPRRGTMQAPVAEETEPALLPQPPKAVEVELAGVKDQVKQLMAAGHPKIKLSVSAAKLAAYVALYGDEGDGTGEGEADRGQHQEAGQPVGAEANR